MIDELFSIKFNLTSLKANILGSELPMQARINVDVLSARLREAQAEYEWARSRGDAERATQARIRMQAISAERDRTPYSPSAIKAVVA
jgi:hypothetical protein